MLLRKAQRAGGTDPRTGRPILPLSDDEKAGATGQRPE